MNQASEIPFTIPATINDPAAWTLALAEREVHDGPPGASSNHARLAQATAEARMALEDAATAATTAAVRARAMAERLDEALSALVNGPVAAKPPATADAQASAALSPREREVLALVVEGHSNKAIAEALFVSPNTVKTHVASLLSKLQAGSRAQLAAIATRQALV